MSNSTIKLQDICDYVSARGDLQPIVPQGGFSQLVATGIANDVMTDMLSGKFNFKWNRTIVPPFYTISWQQDYAGVTKNIGWLEHGFALDINNAATPKPIAWLECVRDLERTSAQWGGPGGKVAWLPNDQLTYGVWPGAAQAYTNPLGAVVTPTNPPTMIQDAHGNILALTTYGVTGNTAPDAGASPAIGATVADGSCVWTVRDPNAQGFRLSPLPPQQGVVWQVNLFAQKKPMRFTALGQLLDPMTDDFEKYFRDGFITYCYQASPNPTLNQQFPQRQAMWHGTLAQAAASGDREPDDAMIIPDRGVMDSGGGYFNYGRSNPYGPYGLR